MRVVRRTARAILIDEESRLVLFRRTLPKRKPYWSTPGGGVDPEDDSIEAALHRELAEELGATVDRVQQVFLTSPPRGDGIAVAHFFVCRLVSMDLSLRTGEEFSNPAKGRYDVERIDLRGKKLSRYALQPPEAKEFILVNRHALLETALDASTPPLTSTNGHAADATPETPAAQTPATQTPATQAAITTTPSPSASVPDAEPTPADTPGTAPRTASPCAATPREGAPREGTPEPVPRLPGDGVRVPWVPAPAADTVAAARPPGEPARSRRRGRPAPLEIVDGDGAGAAPPAEPREVVQRPGWWRRLTRR
ncbi:NUDIX domain-containing protein [Frankia sp. AgB32]|uniref:NUDIX domain-containing protein n=1 Tax=Frankia sp. AgB32 TaxID=631119 RepID=UPI0027E25D11|nr:NUDIX domain-containing protein [Frankia sp. AgB32]